MWCPSPYPADGKVTRVSNRGSAQGTSCFQAVRAAWRSRERADEGMKRAIRANVAGLGTEG
jgi:hypothetical protein